MKYIILSLLVCAFASTGWSKPVQDEQLPPIGGFLTPVHPVILNLAKETLSKVQANLNAAGRVEEALHLNKFIKETEKFLDKTQEGEVRANEAFDLNDHLDAIYNVLEHYKEFLPVDKTLALVVPTNEELAEHVRLQLDDLIEQLMQKKEYAKMKLLMFYQKVLNILMWKKSMFMMKKEKFEMLINTILETIRQIIDQLRNAVQPSTGASIEPTSDLDLTLSSFADSDADLVRGLLEGLQMDLEKIEAGLRRDRKLVEAGRIRLYRNIVRAIAANTHGGNADRRSVTYALERGIELVKQYERYLTNSPRFYMNAYALDDDLMPESLDRDDEELIDDAPETLDDDDNLVPSDKEEENLTILQRIRERLVNLRENLRNRRKNLRVRIVETYIRVIDVLIERLKRHQLDNTRFNDIVVRARELLEKFAEQNRNFLTLSAFSENDLEDLERDEDLVDDDVNENDLPDEKEENEHLSTLERIREQLVQLRDRLRGARKNLKARIVETYVRVADALISRLRAHKLDNSHLAIFISRAREILDRYAERNRSYLLSQFSDDEDLNEINNSLGETNEQEDLDHFDEPVDEDDLPNEKEEKENLSTLERIRKQLVDLRDHLRARRKTFRVRVVEVYLRVVDVLIQRLKARRLDKTRFADFVNRVKDLLENYADANRY